jgi:hypothetical protein
VYVCGGRKPRPKPIATPRPVSEIAADTSTPWCDVVLGIGAKGPILTKDKCIRVVEVRDMMAGKDVWPRIGMLEDGSVKHAPRDAPADATPEEIRTPAPPHRAGEQCFPERENYLGPDHHDARSRSGRHRHILFPFMAHPFINKLRRTRGIKVDSPPGSAPFFEVPVPTKDYRNAVVETLNVRPISHPRTGACPNGPQQILSIGW